MSAAALPTWDRDRTARSRGVTVVSLDAASMRAAVAPPRRVFVVVLAAAAALALLVPAVGNALEARDRGARDRVTGIAAALRDPAGLVAAPAGCALRGSGTVRCATIRTGRVDAVRALAAQARQALSAAAGRPTSLECWDLGPPRERTTSCLVQVRDGDHAVSVWLDSLVERRGGAARVVGAEYVVQAA